MTKYLAFFKNSLLTWFEYRVNILGTLLNELVGVTGIVILYWSVFSNNQSVAGYNLSDTLGYYLLVPLAGFITQVYVSNDLPDKIRLGGLSSYLIKPFKVWLSYFANTLATKLNFLIIVLPIWILLVFLFEKSLGSQIIMVNNLAPALTIALLALVMHFVFDLALSLTAFWFDDIWSLQHFKNILFEFLGGVSFPLVFLQGNIKTIVNLLPFKYLYYVPLTYLSGKADVANLNSDILILIGWIMFFSLIVLILWNTGLKKFGAYGN